MTLHRYFIWANRMRIHFEQVLSKGELDNKDKVESFLYMSYWYGGLYVVIEGWAELQLADPAIDSLLTSSNVPLLRRYRNGVFHFQKDYNDKRFDGFMADGLDSVEWVRSLNAEFSRYLLAAVTKAQPA